jgi:hypothetical protein
MMLAMSNKVQMRFKPVKWNLELEWAYIVGAIIYSTNYNVSDESIKIL